MLQGRRGLVFAILLNTHKVSNITGYFQQYWEVKSNRYLLNKKLFLKRWNNNVCSSDFDSNISSFGGGVC